MSGSLIDVPPLRKLALIEDGDIGGSVGVELLALEVRGRVSSSGIADGWRLWVDFLLRLCLGRARYDGCASGDSITSIGAALVEDDRMLKFDSNGDLFCFAASLILVRGLTSKACALPIIISPETSVDLARLSLRTGNFLGDSSYSSSDDEDMDRTLESCKLEVENLLSFVFAEVAVVWLVMECKLCEFRRWERTS